MAGADEWKGVIKAANPDLLPKAQRWKCHFQEHHGFSTMAEIMTQLNPLTGQLYQEGLEFTRLAREKFALLHGKYPHPQTIVPGGVSTTVTMETLNEYHSKIGRIFDYGQRMIGVWDELTEFFYDADDRYRQVGTRPMNFIDNGYWDDP